MRFLESGVKNVSAASDVCVVMPCNLYGCKLSSGVFIGPFVEIQEDVVIGERTRIQSHSFICSKVSIGTDCFIGHGVMFVNDKFKNGVLAKRDEWLESSIGNRVLIGSNAVILPVKICDDVVIGAGSVVTRDILESGTYAGNPARRIKSSVDEDKLN